jgi:sterol 3beta-glucosyltransferase
VHVTGYYFLPPDNSYQPPAELLSFLQEGESPVCITFGSMVNPDKDRIDRIVQESLKRTGRRGIILSGWSGVEEAASNDLLYLEDAPHDWLLPRCKMAIHHGGAGTTAAALQAGIPSIVIPFLGDQSFWGARVYALGGGPRPIRVKSLSVEKLTRAMAEAENDTICKRAQAIGQNLRNENGTGKSVEWIEKYSNNFHT